jgi:hypothetical protein
MSFSTKTAPRIAGIKAGRNIASFSADTAKNATQLPSLERAILTNWNPGNLNQRSTTNAAIGGKKSKEEAGSNALCPANDRRGRSCGLGSPYSKPGTAEDGLPHPECGAAATGDNLSIASPLQQRNLTSGQVVDSASQD